MKRIVLLILVLAGVTLPAYGAVITMDPNIPPGGPVAYRPVGDAHTIFPVGMYGLEFMQTIYGDFVGVNRTANGPDEVVTFSLLLTGLDRMFMDLLGTIMYGDYQPVSMTGTATVVLANKRTGATGTFTTELTTLDLTGEISDGSTLFIRESPSLQSTGQTTITDIGGGSYRIDSFFDVFFEIGAGDGTWYPSQGSTRLQLESVPEPAPAALAGLGFVLLACWQKLQRR